MKQFFILSFCQIVLILGISIQADAVELNLFIWDDYISQDVLDLFQKQTGIIVNQVFYDSDKSRDEVMASAGGKQFDVVLSDNVSAQIFGKNNHLLALNESEVPNLAQIEKNWEESCGNFGIPYFYGTTGLVYDKTRYAEKPDSWKYLLMPDEAHRGHVVMVEDFVDTLLPALIYKGYSINSEDETELKEAYALLQSQLPAVLNYNYALSNFHVDEKKNSMHIAFAYSGDQHSLNEMSETENWEYVVPREGTAIWVDCLSVTSWTKKRDAAMAFLNFINDPEISAINAEEMSGATPNSGAKKRMSPEALNDAELFVPEEVLKSAQSYRILSDANLRLRGRILDALIKQHETQ